MSISKMNMENRFEEINNKSSFRREPPVDIIIDHDTGVQYICVEKGITVLVGADGKPLLYKPE